MRRIVVLWTVCAVVVVGPVPARAAGPDVIPPVDGPIIAHFEAPAGPYGPGHRGIDFAAPEGSPVVAVAAGVVAFAGQVGGRLYVSIDHEGFRSTYSYLAGVMVRAGQQVRQGEVVAASGIGHGDDPDAPPHLHLGFRVGGDYLDPEPLLLAAIRRNLWRVIGLAA